MRILPDTECWLWSLTEKVRLTDRAQPLMADREHAIYLSAASCWEIAINYRLGRLPLPELPETYIPSRMQIQGIGGLAIEPTHALRVAALPPHHRVAREHGGKKAKVGEKQVAPVALRQAPNLGQGSHR